MLAKYPPPYLSHHFTHNYNASKMRKVILHIAVIAIAVVSYRCAPDDRPIPAEAQKSRGTGDRQTQNKTQDEVIADAGLHSDIAASVQGRSEPNAQEEQRPGGVAPDLTNWIINGEFGRASGGSTCPGFGICWAIAFGDCVYGPCPDEITVDIVGNEDYFRFYIPEGSGFTIFDPFYVDNSDVLGSTIAAQLGYNEIILQTGSYTAVAVPGTTDAHYVDVPITSIN